MKPTARDTQKNAQKRPVWVIALVMAILASLVLAGTALAGQFEGDDIYRLEAGQVVNDDLYVAGSEIFIDGTVNGDLYAVGGYIEVNGTVTGDVVAAGGGIKITGDVQDDARLAGGGIDILGTIGDDLIIAGGGWALSGFSFPMQVGTRSINQGIRLGNKSSVGGDAEIVGGTADIRVNTGKESTASTGKIDLDAQVGGNATLNASALRLTNNSRIEAHSSAIPLPRRDEPARRCGRGDRVRASCHRSDWGQPSVVHVLVASAHGDDPDWLWAAGLADHVAGPGFAGKTGGGHQRQPGGGRAAVGVKLVFVLFMALPIASGIIVVLIGMFWEKMLAIAVGLLPDQCVGGDLAVQPPGHRPLVGTQDRRGL